MANQLLVAPTLEVFEVVLEILEVFNITEYFWYYQ